MKIFTGIFVIAGLFIKPSFGMPAVCAENLLIVSDTVKINDDSVRITVYISFTVNKKGKVKAVKVFKTEGDSFDVRVIKNLENEAVRVVRETPPMNPAKMNGKPQKRKYILPVKFVIPKDNGISH